MELKRWIEGVETPLDHRGTSAQEVETTKRYDDRRDWKGFLRGSLTDRQECLPGILVREARK